MRVLILSVGTGHGHHQVGSAIMKNLEEYDNVQCTKIDTFKYINRILGSSLSEGYLMATKYTPKFYGTVYRLAEKRKPSENLSVFRAFNTLLSRKLTYILEDYRPDVTVCTHVFAAQIVTVLKKKNLAGITMGIVTDFTIHPYWEETDLNYYITPSELLNDQAIHKGIPLEKIRPLGIPIFEKFSQKISKTEARKMVGIEDRPTVLVIGGSMGYGNITEIIQQLDFCTADFQILCVCGNNAALKQKIDTMKIKKKLYSFGFVNNIDVLMDASDCIITKPGGLTVSESLAKGLPLILTDPIPGQEERNADFLKDAGASITVDTHFTADKAVHVLLSDPWKRYAMLEAVHRISRPHASQDVCDLILQQIPR